MGAFYGLLAAFGYGVSDFVATGATRRIGVIRAAAAAQVFGFIAIALVILFRGEGPRGSAAEWIMVAVSAIASFAGVLFLYRSFAIGTLALVSPIASGFAAVTAVLALADGERPPSLAVVGTTILVIGVAVVSRTRSQDAATLAGVPEAIGAAFGFGIGFWLLGKATPETGPYWPVLITRAIQFPLTFAMLRWRSERFPTIDRSTLPVFLTIGTLDSGALLAFNLGVDSAYTTTTTALTSLYSVVTVFLAWTLLRERLSISQWAGVAVVLGGVFLVSL